MVSVEEKLFLEGTSRYPIADGYVIRLASIRRRHNWKLKKTADHYLYVWIRHVYKQTENGKRPQDRKVNVLMFYKPVMATEKFAYIMKERPVTVRYLTKILSSGYDILSRTTRWDYVKANSKRFYQIIGMI